MQEEQKSIDLADGALGIDVKDLICSISSPNSSIRSGYPTLTEKCPATTLRAYSLFRVRRNPPVPKVSQAFLDGVRSTSFPFQA